MLCAISMNVKEGDVFQDILYSDYVDFFERLGCSLVLIPNATKSIESYFDNFKMEGIILSGGNDLSSEFTGQKNIDIRNASSERDSNEKAILDIALKRKLPVLGICRGMQFINCYFGGSLSQRISEESDEKNIHIAKTHVVSLCDRLAIEFFGKEKIKVNSYHHQGVRVGQISSQLKIMGFCEQDNLVEALYHPLLPIAGVQWHPERNNSSFEDSSKLAKAFVERKLYWEIK